VSIFNFHYATPPETVAMNYALNRVIGDDETGFRGVSDEVYRTEGWEFVLAGGGLYNNLDYSFAVGFEDGTFRYPDTQPGGGGPALRRQLRILRDFITSVDFTRMAPDDSIIKGGTPPGGAARALVERGRTIAIYLRRHAAANEREALHVDLPDGQWRAEWIDTLTGAVVRTLDVSGGGTATIATPDYAVDIALRLRRQ
jgi:hypothetical protein